MRLRFLFAWVLGAVGVIAACAQSGAPVECAPNQQVCGSLCVDVTNDREHCGACNVACPGAQVCAAGKCAQQCPGGGLSCGGSCVNAKYDNANCGSCGKACKPGEVCSQGVCGTSCQGVTTCMVQGAPQCADTKNDNLHCGKCNTPCKQGEACVGGVCQGACEAGQTLCEPEAGAPFCANLDSDNANCGECGKPCGKLDACVGGQCVPGCAPFQTLCTVNNQTFCANTLSDNANCGTCGNVCPQNQPVCSGGACSTGGSSPGTCNELVAKPTIWGRACTGFDLRKRTKSTLHFIGCIDNESCTFYCTYNAQNQTLEFGTKSNAALRAQVDPNNASGDTFGGNYQCCSAQAQNGICNAPESTNNGVNVNMIKALCNALGYQNGTVVRQQNSNACPQAHTLDATGTSWTSNWQSDSAGGLEYKCTGFL